MALLPARLYREAAMIKNLSSLSGGLRAFSASTIAFSLVLLGGFALAQQDKYALKVPGSSPSTERDEGSTVLRLQGLQRTDPRSRTTSGTPHRELPDRGA
jgi:hypothetical protein